MAHCPHCKSRVTRWWWFAKVFGQNDWTARCRGCGLTCAIHVGREFSRWAKFWAIMACLGIYIGVAGGIYSANTNLPPGPPTNHTGHIIGWAGFGILAVSLGAALITDIRNSKVALTAVVLCHACGERLPDDFDEADCPVCGETL